MRPKVLSLLLAGGFCLLGVLAAVWHNSSTASRLVAQLPVALPDSNWVLKPYESKGVAVADFQSTGLGESGESGLGGSSTGSSNPLPQVANETNVPAADSFEGRHDSFVAARVAELRELSMNEDATSLDSILSDLNNREPRIRAASLEAAIQFGSRDALPKLMDAAAQTDDPREKAALAEAIEFLKLPSLTEVVAQGNALGSVQR